MGVLARASRRLIIVTGKGGTGKTTITAAMARALARQGKRVLVAEVVPLADTPSALADSLGGAPPTEEPAAVAANLWVALLTPAEGHHRFLQDTLPFRLLADAAMRSGALRKFLSAAPGFADMGVMYRMLDLMRRKDRGGGPAYEVCLIDSPATGHALALAQIPEFLTRVIPAGPIYRAAAEGMEVLTDPRTTGCVIVTLPETLPVTEALELKRGLTRHRLPVSAIVVNRVPVDPFIPAERQVIRELLKGDTSRQVQGLRELARIERAEVALQALRALDPDEPLSLPEVSGEGPETAEHLIPLL